VAGTGGVLGRVLLEVEEEVESIRDELMDWEDSRDVGDSSGWGNLGEDWE